MAALTPARRVALIVGAVAVLALLGGGLAVVLGDDSAAQTTTTPVAVETTTTSTTTTTTRPTTTTEPTTTTAAGDPSPITGLAMEDPALADRRALVVKIDNFPQARPQSGLPEADAVIELSVEGITRFIAVFHTGDSERVGPVRSLRPTDWLIARLFDAPIVMSGGQGWVQAMNRSNGARLIGELGRPYTFRDGSRPAPHNLYADTVAIRGLADDRAYPDTPPEPIWANGFGDLPAGAENATEIRLDFSNGLLVDWTYRDGQYWKETNGVEHQWIGADGEASQIAVDTLVVLRSRTYPMSGSTGGPAQAVESTGSGAAWVFADGEVVAGTWSRPSPSDPFTLETEDGEPLTVPAGKPWISFLPASKAPSW